MKIILVSGCDDNYVPLLLDMLESLGDNLQKYDLGIFDLKLSESAKSKICDLKPNVIFKKPEWFLDLPEYRKTVFSCATAARPFMREIFPGYDGYMQIDADLWIADSSVIDDYIKAGDKTGLAIASECHTLLPSYFKIRFTEIFGMTFMRGIKGGTYRALKHLFGSGEAVRFGLEVPVNGGLYYLKTDSPVWDKWQKTMQDINWYKVRKKQRVCDQTCLLYALHKYALPYTALAPHYNWLLAEKNTPLLDIKAGKLLDPIYPHTPIKAVHLVIGAHKRQFKIRTTEGDEITSYMTYSAFKALF